MQYMRQKYSQLTNTSGVKVAQQLQTSSFAIMQV